MPRRTNPNPKKEAKKERESNMCLECNVRFKWNQSKEGLCYWCQTSRENTPRRRRKAIDR